jgi:DNA gyrase subunit A
VNALALVDGEPRVLPLKRLLVLFIEHRREVIRRRSEHELKRARHRQHVLEGLRIAIANLDAVIETIRKSADAETARANLMKRFKLTEIQAQAILDLQLRRLAALERQKIDQDYADITRRIAELEALLADPKLVLQAIREDLRDLKASYGDARRTTIIPDADSELSEDDLIAEEDVLITITDRGYIKRVPESTYRVQHRGGRGIKGATPKRHDEVRDNFLANTRDRLLFFSDRGKVYQLPAHMVPDASREAAGTSLANLIQLDRDERVTVALAVPKWEFEHGRFLVMLTRNGRIKRTSLSQYDGVRPSGLIGILLDDGDELSWAKVTSGKDELIIVTRRGRALRFRETDVRPMGRVAAGVSAIRLRAGDQVVALDIVQPEADLFVVTRGGFGKRTRLKEYATQGRYTQGVLTIDAHRLDEIGEIADARVVGDGKEIALITDHGIVMRTWTDVLNRMGRATRGVKVMNLDEGHQVASLAYIIERQPPLEPEPTPPPHRRATSRPAAATNGDDGDGPVDQPGSEADALPPPAPPDAHPLDGNGRARADGAEFE